MKARPETGKVFIYILQDNKDSVVRYVGKATHPHSRLYAHKNNIYKESTYRTNWIKSVQNKGSQISMFIVDEVPESEWRFWEKHYVDLYKSWGFKLTNIAEPGEGPTRKKGYKHTEETKEKCRKVNLGRVHNETYRIQCRMRQLNVPRSAETREHMKQAQLKRWALIKANK